MPLRPLLAVFAAVVSAVVALAVPRTEVSLDAGWRFRFGEAPGAELPAFDDTAWAVVATPHTWNAQDGQDGLKRKVEGFALMKGDYARGSGWYRRTLRFDPAWAGRQVYLQFDAASRRADVFLNGRLVGSHLGGNARFRFDVTAALRRDGENLLAVKVNNEDNGILPHSGDFTFFGGLYRDVALLVTDAVQIETMDHASPGVYLAQTSVTAERAEVGARVKLANHEAHPVDATVRIAILDHTGRVVLEKTTPAALPLAAGARAEVTVPLVLAAPRLWQGRADPYVYTARIEVAVAGTVRDAITQPLGLRSFTVDPARGFFLNGKYLDLRGASRHQDRLDKGWAISADDDREDMALMAEMGCTAIRVAHYQQSPLWYRLADERGMVLWAEIAFVDEALPTDLFFANALQQMRELIRQNFNHPSIVFWGCGNENFDLGQGFVQGIAQYGPISERQIQALHALAKAEDPTRLTTYASFHSERDINFTIPGQPPAAFKGEPQRWYTDTTAFNKYYGWYYGEPEDAAEFFDGHHVRAPHQRLAVSEYGAGGSILQHSATNYGGPDYVRTPAETMRPGAFAKTHPEEFQAYYHERAWAVFAARPYLWGKFIWNMFDFAADGRDEGDTPGRNDKGLVTYDRRTRKDAFYFYKANWSTEPVLHIASRRFTPRTDAVTEVKVYANAPDAELFLNGRSLGRQTVGADRIVRWSGVALAPGANRVRVTALRDGRPLADECVWVLAR